MKKFKHINVQTLDEATSVLKQFGKKAKVISGGTDLLDEMKDNILPEYPEVVVNIKTIQGLDYIREENKSLKIGPLTRLEDIARNETVKNKFTILAEAARQTASPHIREMGTIAGNICQSNRCWYYWVAENRFYCLRKGGKICYALTGDNRYHSIFGATRVNGTPCSVNCPANVDIPSYMSQIREGNLAEAARTLLGSNPFPAITGRVCPHFCEADCNRADLDERVSIRCVERSLGDYVLDNPGDFYAITGKENKKKIAVIGSGPSGLSAAYYLRRSGYKVTVFEIQKEAGGLLVFGIPPYRLPRDVVRKQIQALENMDIQIKTGQKIGQEIKLEQLTKEFDAVYIATGAWKERPAGIKGEELMLSGAAFLREANLGSTKVPGKKVAVIGGGNVAIDVARTLLRLGSEPVIIYRRSRNEMPALKDEVAKAEEESIQFQFLTLPVEAAKKSGRITLRSTKMELGQVDESGRPRPVPVPGSEFDTEYDAVLTATGEAADTSIIPPEFLDAKGQLKIDSNTYALGKNLFAGGDLVTGPATVVAAFAAGRKSAAAIHRFLGGEEKAIEPSKQPARFNSDYLKKTRRAEAPELSVSRRLKSLTIEETGGLSPEVAKMEANRCFNCGCVAVNPSDTAPVLIVLNTKIVTTKRTIEAEKFFTVEGDKNTVLDDDEVVKEIQIPVPAPGSKSAFTKFALRKSIDFPVVNCAAVMESQNGMVKNARICLNSVYTHPYRAAKAEQHITGKEINEANAEAAAESTIAEAFPLINNHYKIQIARTLVKRAIMACI